MRKKLEFPVLEEEKLEKVKALIEAIVDDAEKNCSEKLMELKHITGKAHDFMEFAEYWGWTDLETLAKITLTPSPPYISDITRSELEEIIIIIKDSFVTGEDYKVNYYTELLHKSLPLADVLSYILTDASISEIADMMLSTSQTSIIYL